ncbi:MAG: hypothetical protein KKF12_02705 [Proteobacteria bacterium]|nr:hypothetical protein [Desulfobacula sp.]MBU4129712.1 hypothetical protein [Pseudomonadota bacterium]
MGLFLGGKAPRLVHNCCAPVALFSKGHSITSFLLNVQKNCNFEHSLPKILHLTFLFQIFMVSAVLALAVAETDSLTDTGVVNVGFLAADDIDPDVLDDADKLGLGGLPPGPGSPAGKNLPVGFG